MRVTYEFTATCRCPVDDSVDTYSVTVVSPHTIMVEDILHCVKLFRDQKHTQEEFTLMLAGALKNKEGGVAVKTLGFHSGVRTEVES